MRKRWPVWLVAGLILLYGCGEDTDGMESERPSSEDSARERSSGTHLPSDQTQQQQPRLEFPDDVLYVEAEAFDPDLSTVVSGGTKWEVREDPDAFGGRYVEPMGANRKGVTALIYPLREVKKNKGWTLWVRAIFPPVAGEAADSFFVDISPDPDNWPGRKEFLAGIGAEQWTWVEVNKIQDRQPDKGKNWLKISERESGVKLDVFCLRRDGDAPSDDDYNEYLDLLKQVGNQ